MASTRLTRSAKKRLNTSLGSDANVLGTQSTRPGFLSMPHELMLEIPQYLGPSMEVSDPDSLGRILPYPPPNKRRTALRALSQTCRALRLFFLPLAWECLDNGSAKINDRNQQPWEVVSRCMSENLESKSRGLAETWNLAAYVHIVNVGIVPNSGAVFSAFAKCLQSLPNLHTLQIGGIIGPVEMPIKTAFKGYRFPQIRTVVFPTLAHHILSSCPQVRNVTCTGHHQDKVVNVIAKRCKKVEALCIMALSNDRLKIVAKGMPNLCQISLRLRYPPHVDADGISILAALPRLHTIILREEWDFLGEYETEDDPEARFQPIIQAAVDVLKEHEGDESGNKWIKIWHKKRTIGPGIKNKLWTKVIQVGP